jgi:ATP-dependent DNA helicase RecG
MLTRLIDKADAGNLISRQEDHFLDFKSASLKGISLQKIATAFANADGGEILIGIEDTAVAKGSERWAGFATVEDFNGHLQALNEVRPQLPMSLGFLACEGLSGIILQIAIEKSSQVHQTASGDVYLRRGAQSLPIKDAEQLVALKFAKGLSSFEDTAVANVPLETVVESEELQRFLTTFSPKTEPLDYVVNENLLDLKSWDPKVSGLVLFAPNPSAVIPTRAGVRVTRYETKEEDPERDHLAFSELIESSAYRLILNVIARITEIMSSISIWTVDGLKKVQYPPEVLKIA